MTEPHGRSLIDGTAPNGGAAADIDRAVHLATVAFRDYRRTAPGPRAAFLRAIATEVERRRPAIVDQAGRETGCDEARLTAELSRCVRTVEGFARVVEDGSWRDVTTDPGRAATPEMAAAPELRRWLIPVGPVAVFGASNVPLMGGTLGTDTVSALAAGCPVVVRGHPAHPGTSELLAAAALSAVAATEMSPGVFALLQGASHEIGLALVRAPGIKTVAFTGSLAGGRALFDAAASRPEPVPVYAEMGSVNPVVVLPGALAGGVADLAEGLATAVTRAGGQLCTKPGVVLVPDRPESDRLVAAVARRIATVPPAPMLHAGVHAAYLSKVDGFGRTGGVEVAFAETEASGRFVRGAVLSCSADTFLANADLRVELFGPAVLFVRYTAREDLLAIADRLAGELTASLHGTEAELAGLGDLVDELATKVGRILWNGYPTGTPEGAAMHHGGPYPAATDPRYTSIGPAAIRRFARPVVYQNFPERLLPEPLRNHRPEAR